VQQSNVGSKIRKHSEKKNSPIFFLRKRKTIAVKNLLLRFFLTLLKPLIPSSGKTNRILVVSTTGLGDTLWATPALEALKKSFPNAHIAVLTSPTGMQVLKNNPYIDQIFLCKSPIALYFFSLWKILLKEKFETILLFHASERLVLPLCTLLGASQIIGTSGINKGLDFLLTKTIRPSPIHEIERRLEIIHQIGASIQTKKLSFFLTKQETIAPRKSGLQIALHPGAKDGFKRWPYFAELGNLLKNLLPCDILITGTEEEADLMQSVAKQIPGARIQGHSSSLREFAAMIGQVDLLISNDTGPLHLACALNIPVIGIYCSTDPALCGPYEADKAITIVRPPTCTPCLRKKCKEPFCFLQISPKEVAASAKHFLSLLRKTQTEELVNLYE
jgi:ADP-heptose:LPS heptosyltransferase